MADAADPSEEGEQSLKDMELQPAEPLTHLPEVEDDGSIFTTSSARITLPSERARHPMVFWLSALLVTTALLGLANGMDYIEGDSGLIRHRRFINLDAQAAPAGSATLLGQVVYENGQPAPNHIVQVTVKNDEGVIFERSNTTDENGNFRIDELDPGVQVLLIANGSRGTAQMVQHLVLLNPPPKVSFEPIGFTTLKLVFPSDETFEEESSDGSFINHVPYEAENELELYDSSAAGIYVMVGVGFSGLALIGLAATALGYKENSRGMLRMASVLLFFSQGPYSSACCFGLLAFALTFALPKPRSD